MTHSATWMGSFVNVQANKTQGISRVIFGQFSTFLWVLSLKNGKRQKYLHQHVSA